MSNPGIRENKKKPAIENLLVLNVDAIKDFQTCERLFDYRHRAKDYEYISQRELLHTRFENILKKVVSFYFYKKQAGTVPSYSALLNRWERLWFPKDMTSYDLGLEQHEPKDSGGNIASYSNAAAASLLKFYEDFENDPGLPLLIDEEFTYLIRPEIRLQGRFDLVLREKSSYKVVKWSASPRRPTLASLLLDFAAIKAAFEQRNEGRRLDVKYGVYDLASSKPGFLEMEINPEDLNALTFWANSAYQEEVFPSRRGMTAYCKACPFDTPCKNWKEWPNE